MDIKSILITGGTGSFGKAFIKKIVEDYPDIDRLVIFSRDELKQFEMAQIYTNEKYPQIRETNWDRKLVINNTLGWSAYLLGYEFLFRGILLFPLVDALGVWPAIAINTAMYSATHIPKGMDEAIGAAPLGIVLCLITLMTGTLWVAIVVHILMALANSFSSVYHNPEMKFVR